MTFDKAIQFFKSGKEHTECDTKKDLYETAIKAIEKQIPKTPNETETYYKCPSCNKYIECNYPYCFECGQKIDWT